MSADEHAYAPSTPRAASNPLVSAIIVCFNHAEFVSTAISSAVTQIGVDVEVIVVDDASTDATAEVLDGFGDQISVIRNVVETERGVARNRGAKAGRGDFIAFLDADDRWLPEKLISQVRLARGGHASVTNFEYVNRAGRLMGGSRAPQAANLADILSGPVAVAAGSSLMITRQMFDQTGGFPEDLAVQGCEDWLFMAKLLAAGVQLQVVAEPLVRVTVHDRQSTSTASRRAVLWAGVGWLEAHGYVRSVAARRLRARVAGVVGAGYAFEGSVGEAMRWLARVGHQRLTGETARAACRMVISFATGALRRRGMGALVDSVREAGGALTVRWCRRG